VGMHRSGRRVGYQSGLWNLRSTKSSLGLNCILYIIVQEVGRAARIPCMFNSYVASPKTFFLLFCSVHTLSERYWNIQLSQSTKSAVWNQRWLLVSNGFISEERQVPGHRNKSRRCIFS
jgi:hypothetical protein